MHLIPGSRLVICIQAQGCADYYAWQVMHFKTQITGSQWPTIETQHIRGAEVRSGFWLANIGIREGSKGKCGSCWRGGSYLRGRYGLCQRGWRRASGLFSMALPGTRVRECLAHFGDKLPV